MNVETLATPYPYTVRGGESHWHDSVPGRFHTGPDATLSEKIEGMKRFRKDLALD